VGKFARKKQQQHSTDDLHAELKNVWKNTPAYGKVHAFNASGARGHQFIMNAHALVALIAHTCILSCAPNSSNNNAAAAAAPVLNDVSVRCSLLKQHMKRQLKNSRTDAFGPAALFVGALRQFTTLNACLGFAFAPQRGGIACVFDNRLFHYKFAESQLLQQGNNEQLYADEKQWLANCNACKLSSSSSSSSSSSGNSSDVIDLSKLPKFLTQHGARGLKTLCDFNSVAVRRFVQLYNAVQLCWDGGCKLQRWISEALF
jgi:hypothetical protein